VVFISTPKGKNYFYDLFQLGLSADNPNYRSYKGSSYDTPYIHPQEIQDAKLTLPPNIFRQEYMAEFIDNGGEVFTHVQECSLPQWPATTGNIFCGVDLGRADDYTVATFMDQSGHVVEIYRNRQAQWSTMVREMLQLIRKWNATVMIEVNSIGDVVYEMLKKEWQNTHAFTTTGHSKPEIIEGLILDMAEGKIKIPGPELFPALHHELGIFTYEYNPRSRSIKYGAPAPHHDDCVMSLAIVNYNRKQNLNTGTYVTMGRNR
jgi:hypothetical protein